MMHRVPRRLIAALSVLLLVASVLPLYGLSFFNHPFYDDLGFSVEVHKVWRDTADLGQTIAKAWQHARLVRHTWQGAYTATLLSNLQPGLFSETYYWMTTFLLLTAFLACFGTLLATVARRVLHADWPETITAVCLLLWLLTQLLPSAEEAFFWFNGGIGYAFCASLFALSLALCLRLEQARSTGGAIGLIAALTVLLCAVGGGSYSGGLFAVCVYACVCVAAFAKRSRRRFVYVVLTLWLVACFAYSMTAPGNAVRAQTLMGGMSAPKAILEAVYFGVALLGSQFSLPLAAVLLALAVLLAPALKRSTLTFYHPLWLTLLCGCLFCAQLTPTLYTGNYLGDGRVRNLYWFAYVLMMAFLTLYWTGWLTRKTGWEPRLRLAPLLVAAALFVTGCVAYHPDGAPSYGPQNTAGGSALRSLVSGEAAAYDAAMDAREVQLRDPAVREVALTPAPKAPACFMGDALRNDNADYVCSLLADYYGKDSVTISETEGTI